MQTIKVNTYTYDELTDAAKDAAYDAYHESDTPQFYAQVDCDEIWTSLDELTKRIGIKVRWETDSYNHVWGKDHGEWYNYLDPRDFDFDKFPTKNGDVDCDLTGTYCDVDFERVFNKHAAKLRYYATRSYIFGNIWGDSYDIERGEWTDWAAHDMAERYGVKFDEALQDMLDDLGKVTGDLLDNTDMYWSREYFEQDTRGRGDTYLEDGTLWACN